MLRFITILATFIVCFQAKEKRRCKDHQLFQFEGKCYVMLAFSANDNMWKVADYCREVFDATLLSINSAEENKALVEHSFGFHIVTGLYKNGDGEYKWADGSKVTYTNFANTGSNNNQQFNHTLMNGYTGKWVER